MANARVQSNVLLKNYFFFRSKIFRYITRGFLEDVRYQIKSLEAQQNTTHWENGSGNARKVEKEKKYAKKKKF